MSVSLPSPQRFAKTALLAITSAAVSVSEVWAGEYFERDGAALRGHDPVAYFKDGKPTKGSAEHRFEYKGTVFLFASKANRDAFAADPDTYAPQYGGYCAFGTASGYKAAVDPAAFSVVNRKLYLNYNRDVQKQWLADVPGFVSKADRQWPAVSRQPTIIE